MSPFPLKIMSAFSCKSFIWTYLNIFCKEKHSLSHQSQIHSATESFVLFCGKLDTHSVRCWWTGKLLDKISVWYGRHADSISRINWITCCSHWCHWLWCCGDVYKRQLLSQQITYCFCDASRFFAMNWFKSWQILLYTPLTISSYRLFKVGLIMTKLRKYNSYGFIYHI